MYSPAALALAAAPLVLVAQAEVELDFDKVPSACRAICGPLGKLAADCDTDLRSDNERDEKLLEAQCVCTNKSFDVPRVAALCAACMHQNSAAVRKRDDDDRDRAGSDHLREIDDILATCGFASTTYAPSATGFVQNVTVVASAPTDIGQLTTTLAGSPANTGGSASRGGSGTASGSVTTTTSSPQTSGASTSASQAAAPGVRPLGGVSAAGALYVAGAVVGGGLMMLA